MAYKSPIEIIQEEARLYYEDAVVKAIQPYLITVNKDELIEALKYDRAQYEKGYADGRAARDAEIVRCKDCRFHAKVIDEITGCHVCGVFAAPTKDDDFCSYGQRKKEVE